MSMFGAGSLHRIVVQNVYVWGWILTQDCSTECLCLGLDPGAGHRIVVQNVYVWGWILTQDCSTECLCLGLDPYTGL